MKRLSFLASFFFFGLTAFSQENFPVNGVQDERLEIYAFINATIVQDANTILENAVMVIREGIVESVGASVPIPDGAIIYDLKGKYLYPSIIDIYSNYGMSEVKSQGLLSNAGPQYKSNREGSYGWNDAIKSDYNAAAHISSDKKTAEKLRSQGIGTVLTFRPDGIVRGSSVLVSLNDEPIQESIIQERISANYSFSKGSSTQAYPSSFMGSAALLRQTYYDAEWYLSPLNKDQTNLSLKSFNELLDLPQIIEVSNKYQLLVADDIGDEFNRQFIIKGSGDEYQRLDEIKSTGASLIIPVDFPLAYDVENPDNVRELSLTKMKHWELASSNAAMLAQKDIPFALTSHGLKDPGIFMNQVRKAVESGLNKKEALVALTETPAGLLNIQDKLGSLEKGKIASFLIVSGDLFDKETVIYDNWVAGDRFIIHDFDLSDYNGKYKLSIGQNEFSLAISGKPGSQSAKIKVNDTTEVKATIKLTRDRIVLNFKLSEEVHFQLTGWTLPGGFKGDAIKNDGSSLTWAAVYSGPLEKNEEDKKIEDEKSDPGSVIYPFVAFGKSDYPTQETILYKNATVWTNEEEGIIQNADVLIRNGKIEKLGKNLKSADARIIDATGKHLTSGIIDEHSHIALFSVNEGSAPVTSEVRMKDVLNPEDPSIYRQLAGGVTAAQLLHGSSDPIGAQSVIIKLRWGAGPDALQIKGADKYIKFALGENVKQSNWGDNYKTRFPQSRMGVEQVFVDAFTRAVEYREEWEVYNKLDKKIKQKTPRPRRDLKLETLVEILESDRFITCHSYVQSEINMLMQVADQFDFRVNTFTHILEGYKVADKMFEHGAGGSTFSDWWAYKYEVKDAIPYNMVLLNEAGVVTAVNSDDAEMARRLNQEAAKAVKYGGMSEEDAWKMVTLNPARLLHLEDRMGSVKAGKDADIVLWSNNPLSIYAVAELTMVDGRIYYDLKQDSEMRQQISKERAVLVDKMMKEKSEGKKVTIPVKDSKHHWHCDDIVIQEF